MKPFAILIYPSKAKYIGMFGRGEGQTGRVWVSPRGVEYKWYDQIEDGMTTFYFDDEKTRNEMIAWLKEERPNDTFCLADIKEVYYPDVQPHKVGVFSDKGFLPK